MLGREGSGGPWIISNCQDTCQVNLFAEFFPQWLSGSIHHVFLALKLFHLGRTDQIRVVCLVLLLTIYY